jgi:hypothetical protein
MLKKEETVKGAIVEVFQIKKGVPGASPDHANAAYVAVTAEAGGILNGGKGVGVGTRLEIVEPPKRRNGINTVVVKFPIEGGEYQGHVYWCELRASCKLVQAASAAPVAALPPARKKSGVLKEFSEKQLERLPAAGYLVEMIGDNSASATFYCVKNGAVKYFRGKPDGTWATLMWSCCPTAKTIAGRNPHGITYRHFADYDALRAAYPEIAPLVKAPNDD